MRKNKEKMNKAKKKKKMEEKEVIVEKKKNRNVHNPRDLDSLQCLKVDFAVN